MSEVEYVGWWDQNLRTWKHYRVKRPCEDCLTSWATEQRELGRCNGVPSDDVMYGLEGG